MPKVPMTIAGAERLRAELNELKAVQRPKISKAIAEAREHGDLKENAEYHAAREQQSFCEGRITEIEAKLSESEIIDISKIEPNGKVIFGTTVTLFNLDTDESVSYQIVGEDDGGIPGYDGRFYAERLAAALGRITEAFGWNAKELFDGNRQTSLFSF